MYRLDTEARIESPSASSRLPRAASPTRVAGAVPGTLSTEALRVTDPPPSVPGPSTVSGGVVGGGMLGSDTAGGLEIPGIGPAPTRVGRRAVVSVAAVSAQAARADTTARHHTLLASI